MLFELLQPAAVTVQRSGKPEFSPTVSTERGYVDADVRVWIEPDGRLFLTSHGTEVCRIRWQWSAKLSPQATVLGDRWERAYGDLQWVSVSDSDYMPWYFALKEGAACRCVGVMTAPNAMCYWTVSPEAVCLTADVRCGGDGIDFGGKTLEIAQVLLREYTGDAFSALTRFCRELCPHPRLPETVLYGGDDWYCTYGFSTQKTVLDHTRRIAACANGLKTRPYSVIDAGWNLCCTPNKYIGGPWIPNGHFPDMKQLAEDIRAMDVLPGIWYRPLETMERLPHDCSLRYNEEGTPTDANLDPSKPETLEQIRTEIRRFRDWGYRMLKEDFTGVDMLERYGFDMGAEVAKDGWHFYDRQKTTAQIAKQLYRVIREAAGDDMIISGCNSFNHLCAGIYEFMRTGDDTSGLDWERTKKMGVNTLAFRLPHHNALYSAYADCVGITGRVPWEKNRQWLDVLSKSGTPTFVSIAADSFAPEVQEAVTAAFSRASENTETSRPLDWLETPTPHRWESRYGIDEYTW